MTNYRFNQAPLDVTPMEGFSTTAAGLPEMVEATPNLRQASLSNAVLFGGPLVRDLLEQVPLGGKHSEVFVDTKVSMLMSGWYPAIPGWHTDGVPRPNGRPSLASQIGFSGGGVRNVYHSIIVGNPCLTEFQNTPDLTLDLTHGEDEGLYSEMDQYLSRDDNTLDTVTLSPLPGYWVTWDWWQIHRAVAATQRGWRLLIRVTESDLQGPRHTDFIRTQNQVYVPTHFGW